MKWMKAADLVRREEPAHVVRGSLMRKAFHEAGHAVAAIVLGGFAEFISLIPSGLRDGGCWTSWPDDQVDRTRERILTLAAGPAATSIYSKRAQGEEIFRTGLADDQMMQALGHVGGDEVYTEARRLCRRNWQAITAVAHGVLLNGGMIDEAGIQALVLRAGRR